MHKLLIPLGCIILLVAEALSPIGESYTDWINAPYRTTADSQGVWFNIIVITFAALSVVYGLVRLLAPNAKGVSEVLSRTILALVFVMLVLVLANVWCISLLAIEFGAKLLTNFMQWSALYGLGMLLVLVGVLSMCRQSKANVFGMFVALLLMSLVYVYPGYIKMSDELKEHYREHPK